MLHTAMQHLAADENLWAPVFAFFLFGIMPIIALIGSLIHKESRPDALHLFGAAALICWLPLLLVCPLLLQGLGFIG